MQPHDVPRDRAAHQESEFEDEHLGSNGARDGRKGGPLEGSSLLTSRELTPPSVACHRLGLEYGGVTHEDGDGGLEDIRAVVHQWRPPSG